MIETKHKQNAENILKTHAQKHSESKLVKQTKTIKITPNKQVTLNFGNFGYINLKSFREQVILLLAS